MRSPSFVLGGGRRCELRSFALARIIRHSEMPVTLARGCPPSSAYRRVAPPPVPGWRDCAPMRSRAAGHGKISPRCIHEGASDKKNASSWQYIAAMYSNTANFGKICVACIRKAPQSAVGECTARASCRQGAFSPSEALRSCTAHKSCHPLMALPLRRGSCPSNRIAGSPSNCLALAQGCLPQRLADTRHLPLAVLPPAPRQCSSSRRIQLSAMLAAVS